MAESSINQLISDSGKVKSNIDVRISYRIIELFSEGLYKSPHKAIEELVSNAFDAGATKTQVILSPDLGAPGAIIAVVDNGIGMNGDGLEQHWIIGVSNKRDEKYKSPKDRIQIGKFGIGKLATFVLSNKLTHITKFGKKYFATTMDYKKIPHGEGGGIYTEKVIQIPLRELTEKEAKLALSFLEKGKGTGYTALGLFGKNSPKTWTVAILSNLKDMARDIQRGRLRWVLSTAMPLRDDFTLYLDGDIVDPSKIQDKRLKRWVLGKDLAKIPKPAPDDLETVEDKRQSLDSIHHFGLVHKDLGRITGYVELYDSLLTIGKSADWLRSHGFFVYVRGRLINIDDEYFGISSNDLRHGTFSRFRMVVYIDKLDDELRSTRETVREGSLFETARNLLKGTFNFVQSQQKKLEEQVAIGSQATSRIASTPYTLTQKPLLGLIEAALKGDYTPKYLRCPSGLSKEQRQTFMDKVQQDADSETGLLKDINIVEDLSQIDGIAVFDTENGILKINVLHPFVAHFLDEYNHKAKNVSLELLAMSEVLLEAQLLEFGLPISTIEDILSERDELLRYLSRWPGKRNSYMIASDLTDAATDQNRLENELVAAFDNIGFADAIRIGGKGEPDGYAEARLGGTSAGIPQLYKIVLEAKSKEKPGTKVTAKAVGVSDLARHRRKYSADYSVVVGPDFPTTQKEKSALAQMIKDDRDKNPGKGITLIRIEDMAKLVRIVHPKTANLKKLKELFEQCSIPEESALWINELSAEKTEKPPYKELLEAIYNEQKDMPRQAIGYDNVVTCLRKDYKLTLDKTEVIELCKALSKMAPGYVFARKSTVELNQRPDKVLQAISSIIGQCAEEDNKKSKTA